MLSYRLRHRVAIQEQVETQNSNTGAMTITWENVMLNSDVVLSAVPAEVLTGAGREMVQGGAVQGEITARINMRWFPGLTQAMRVLWDGNVFNIKSIETDLTGRQEYRLKCIAGLNDGQ
jgi:SPP1 family predicted phage head-tail adaptor